MNNNFLNKFNEDKVLYQKYSEIINKYYSIIERGRVINSFQKKIEIASFVFIASTFIYFKDIFIKENLNFEYLYIFIVSYLISLLFLVIRKSYVDYVFKSTKNKSIKYKLNYLIKKFGFNDDLFLNQNDFIKLISPKSQLSQDNKLKLYSLINSNIVKNKNNHHFLSYIENCIMNDVQISNYKIEEEYWFEFEYKEKKEKLDKKINEFLDIKTKYFNYFSMIKNDKTIFNKINSMLNKNRNHTKIEMDEIVIEINCFLSSNELLMTEKYDDFLKYYQSIKKELSILEKNDVIKINDMFIEFDLNKFNDFITKINEFKIIK